ncbi:MAG TPA: hypothetical protein VIJ76_02975 [Galbitalea sp.]
MSQTSEKATETKTPDAVMVSALIPRNLHSGLAAAARLNDRSLSAELRVAALSHLRAMDVGASPGYESADLSRVEAA